ncbi:MAG: PTS sugar transporter subunit IIA [Malacoplasma sp.]|nr:PTS sugar transporter subunit IIA [Malacoplasma sp.]
MQELDLIKNLNENDSIVIQVEANDWKQAINECIKPLIAKKVVSASYVDAIITSVNQNGPYFIIADEVAIPHAQGDPSFVFANGFSLVTLKNPVYFDNDPRPVSILIGLASNSPEIHVAIALPQIVAVFEDEKNIQLIKNAKSKQEIVNIISQVDLKKYLPK